MPSKSDGARAVDDDHTRRTSPFSVTSASSVTSRRSIKSVCAARSSEADAKSPCCPRTRRRLIFCRISDTPRTCASMDWATRSVVCFKRMVSASRSESITSHATPVRNAATSSSAAQAAHKPCSENAGSFAGSSLFAALRWRNASEIRCSDWSAGMAQESFCEEILCAVHFKRRMGGAFRIQLNAPQTLSV